MFNNFRGLVQFLIDTLRASGISFDKAILKRFLTGLVDQLLVPLAASSATPFDDIAVQVLKRIIANGPVFDRFLDWLLGQVQSGSPTVLELKTELGSDLSDEIRDIVWDIHSSQ